VSGLNKRSRSLAKIAGRLFPVQPEPPGNKADMAAMKTDKGAGRLADPRMWRA
jgi:hypothetical protein